MHTFETLDKLTQRCSFLVEMGRQPRPAAGRSAVSDESSEFDSMLIVASGEAVLAGVLLAALMRSTATVPIVVSWEASLPAFTGPNTLVLVLSSTGLDSVGMAALGYAADRESEIMVVTPPGHLTDMAEVQNYTCLTLPRPAAPGALVLAELFFAAWSLLASSPAAAMLMPENGVKDALGAIALMQRQRFVFGPEAPVDRNPARLLTTAFREKTPLVYGTSTVAHAAAVVWADRLRRVGLPAFAGDLAGETRIEGWPRHVADGLKAGALEALILSDPAFPSESDKKAAELRTALGNGVTCNELSLDGKTPMERLWGGVYLAEWTAFYLVP